MERDWERVRYADTEDFDNEPIDENAEEYQGYSWELLKEVKKVFEEEMGIPFDFQWVFIMIQRLRTRNST